MDAVPGIAGDCDTGTGEPVKDLDIDGVLRELRKAVRPRTPRIPVRLTLLEAAIETIETLARERPKQ